MSNSGQTSRNRGGGHPILASILVGALVGVLVGVGVNYAPRFLDDQTVTVADSQPSATPNAPATPLEGAGWGYVLPSGINAEPSKPSTIAPGVPGLVISADVAAYRASDTNYFEKPVNGFTLRDLTNSTVTPETYLTKVTASFLSDPKYKAFVLKCSTLGESQTIGGFVGTTNRFGPCKSGAFTGGPGVFFYFTGTRTTDGLKVAVGGTDDGSGGAYQLLESVLSDLQKQ